MQSVLLVLSFENVRKRGATLPCFPPSPEAHPPLDSKKALRPYRQRDRQVITLPSTLTGFSRKIPGNRSSMPLSGPYQEGLRFSEVGSREEPGQTLGHIVRDHGGSFPSTLTHLNRASRKERPALDQNL